MTDDNTAPKRPLPHNHKKDGTPRRKPIQPTKTQFEDRLFRAEELIRSGEFRDYKVKRMLMKEFDLPRDTAGGYVTRVRKWLKEEVNRPIEDMRVDSWTTYQNIIENPKSSPFAKIKAQARIDRIFGIDRPLQVDIRGSVEHTHAHLIAMTDLDAVLEDLGLPVLDVKRGLLERIRNRKDNAKPEQEADVGVQVIKKLVNHQILEVNDDAT